MRKQAAVVGAEVRGIRAKYDLERPRIGGGIGEIKRLVALHRVDAVADIAEIAVQPHVIEVAAEFEIVLSADHREVIQKLDPVQRDHAVIHRRAQVTAGVSDPIRIAGIHPSPGIGAVDAASNFVGGMGIENSGPVGGVPPVAVIAEAAVFHSVGTAHAAVEVGAVLPGQPLIQDVLGADRPVRLHKVQQ